jgi:hypothetical protein
MLLRGKTSSKNAIYTSMIQSVIEDKIVFMPDVEFVDAHHGKKKWGTSKSGDTQVYLHTKGLKMQLEKYLH